MKVFIKSEKRNIDAQGEFNKETRELTVLKGTIVSKDIAHSEKFKGSRSIEKYREGRIKNSTLIEDIKFKSPSTAGNFVTGKSTNGLTAWKTKEGKTIKEVLGE